MMFADWIVVEDDGTRPYGTGIDVDQRRPLRLVQGEDSTISVEIINPSGGTVVLGPSDFLVLTARTLCAPQRQILTSRSAVAASHRYKISISADTTKTLAPQRGAFDLFIVRGTARSCLIPLSEFILAPSALGNNYQ